MGEYSEQHHQVEAELNATRLAALRQRNIALQQELEHFRQTFAEGFSETAFDYISEEQAPEFIDRWLQQVETETTMMNNANAMGISLFVADLDHQPNLPFEKYSKGSTITFDPTFNAAHMGKPTAQGLAERGGKIKLKGEKPTAKEQLQYFITNGKLHPLVFNMVHELVHHYHHDANLETDEMLSEGQAYCNGIVEAMPLDTIDEMADHMVRDYGYPKDKVVSIIKNILFLYSQEMDTRAVADRVRALNPTFQGDWALEKFIVKPVADAKAYTAEEKDELAQGYLLANEIERAKARDIFWEVFGEWMGVEETEESKKEIIGNQEFGFTPESLTGVVIRYRQSLAETITKYQTILSQPPEDWEPPRYRESVEGTLAACKKEKEYFDDIDPLVVFHSLQKLFNRAKKLEVAGSDSEQICKTLLSESGQEANALALLMEHYLGTTWGYHLAQGIMAYSGSDK